MSTGPKQLQRRRRPERRRRVRREHVVHRSRLMPARRFRVYPDPASPLAVEVLIARDQRRMRDAINWHDGAAAAAETGRCCDGMVRHWIAPLLRNAPRIRPQGVVARMYLHVRALRERPSEIVAHECTHAGMAWARVSRANLSVMPGEEVLCYAVGRLVKQVNRVCFAHGVWP